jgi:hemolysin (HlyC) family protein
MGDTTDGSSSAAHSAQPEDTPQQSSFFARLFAGPGIPQKTTTTSAPDNGTIPSGGLGNLNHLRVEDVSVPRADITAVPVNQKLDDLIRVFRESGYSRLPVYGDTMDNPLGLIHLKDLALKYGFNGKPARFGLKKMLRPLLFAPPSMPIGVLLQKMQTDRIHMAMVIDEYGGVDGLVTIEDLIEQVVGEIEDEHDADEEQMWVEEKPGVYLCQARMPLDEFEAVTGAGFLAQGDDEEIDTLGGLVVMLAGRVPVRGEVIPHPKGFEFEVLDADPRRIKRLRVCTAPSKGH